MLIIVVVKSFECGTTVPLTPEEPIYWSYTWWFQFEDFTIFLLQIFKTLRSLIPVAVCVRKETTSKSPINHTFTVSLALFFLQDTVTWTWDLLSCHFSFLCALFLHSDSKSLIALPESYLQESSPSRALRLLFSKKALLFPVISEANSRLGAKHASLLLRLSLSKHTERTWKVRSSDAEVRHFSYGTALKTL